MTGFVILPQLLKRPPGNGPKRPMKRSMRIWIWAFLVIAYFWFAWWWMMKPPARYDHVNWPEKRWVIERMQYHGVPGCIQDETGYYFIRNGKRCRL